MPNNTLTAHPSEIVGNDQIRIAIAIEIFHGDRSGARASRIVHRRLEGAAGLAEQHADRTIAEINNGQVDKTIVIEISRGDRVRLREPAA